MASAHPRELEERWGVAVAVLLSCAAWAAGRLHPWPWAGLPGSVLTAAAAWIVVIDATGDVTIAGSVAGAAAAAYGIASCFAHNLVGFVLVGAAAFHWVTGTWYAGIGGAALGVIAAGVLVLRNVMDVDYWLEYTWVMLVSSLFGPGLAMYALIQLQWPARLDAWLLLTGFPFAALRLALLRKRADGA